MAHVQRFDRNTAGRDFVIGDIHGCFDQVGEALARVHFDESCDRLFAVGDLILPHALFGRDGESPERTR